MFERIAAALERIAPPILPQPDWLSAPAYVWEGERASPVPVLGALPLDRLKGIDEQKQAVCDNIARLASGNAAHDMLLWGARGMGKSALIRAAVAANQSIDPQRLALVQLAAGTLPQFPALIEALRDQQRAFLLFIDDLGFGDEEGRKDNLALRSLLDGGVVPRPHNVRLAVTSNRRAIVERRDNHAAMHERDERDDALALADRFGLRLGFHPCDRETYLAILRAYTDLLDLSFDEDEALAWAIQRGNRSGRVAYQFAVEIAGRAGRQL